VLAVARAFPSRSGDVARGDVERGVHALCVALAAEGVDVVVVAGAAPGADGATECDGLRVERIARADRHPEHWQKSLSSAVAARFREIVRASRPDVVHVHQWQRLSRDLVSIACAERVPAVLSLHDAWISCLIGTRVLPDTHQACDAPLAAMPCLSCAQKVPPRTPWVPLEGQFMALAERERDLKRELELARAVLVPTRAQADALKRHLGASVARVELEVHAPFSAHDARGSARRMIAVYERAIAAGAPASVAGETWFDARMRAFAQMQWDERAGQASAAELGFEPSDGSAAS
jgi:hypothetical protein